MNDKLDWAEINKNNLEAFYAARAAYNRPRTAEEIKEIKRAENLEFFSLLLFGFGMALGIIIITIFVIVGVSYLWHFGADLFSTFNIIK